MRLRLTVAYVGTAYSGWQVQPEPPTVQRALEDAVARIGGRRVRVTGASRTDAGVHAAGQVCHFDAPRELPTGEWRQALNAGLPTNVRVLEACRVRDDFDARHHARRKRYVYRIDTAAVASPFLAPYAWHRPGLEGEGHEGIATMVRGAGELLIDDLDQRRFASQPEEDGRRIRPLERCDVSAPVGRPETTLPLQGKTTPDVQEETTSAGRGEAVSPGPLPTPCAGPPSLVTVTVVGRSFLRHAVRGMIGTLVEVAAGRRSWEEFQALVRGDPGHRPLSCKAPAHGLCLERVDY